MNKGKAATALAIAVALLAMGALAVLAAVREEPLRGARGAYCGRGRDNGGSRDGRRHRLGRPLPPAVVRCSGTTVDYPIVQDRPESPDFYLHVRRRRKIMGALHRCQAQVPRSSVEPSPQDRHSDGTMAYGLQHWPRDFARGHCTIRVYTREKAIELKVFAADVVDASSEGKRTDRRRGGAHRLPRGQIVPVRGRPGRAFGRRAGLGLRDVQLPG